MDFILKIIIGNNSVSNVLEENINFPVDVGLNVSSNWVDKGIILLDVVILVSDICLDDNGD